MRPDPSLDDSALLDAVQRAGFAYFWDFGHPVSHLARDRSTRDVVSIGGTGMALMCLIVGCERGFADRQAIADRLVVMLRFLESCETHHGMWGHWVDGASGAILPFSEKDDGADLVETAFLASGLICLREYFRGPSAAETIMRESADRLWRRIDWTAHLRPGDDALTWHWSPRHGFAMGLKVTGWSECLAAYILACASPNHPVRADAYHKGWTSGSYFRNGHSYFGIDLPLGPAYGGPLFFSQYSFLGLDPRGLVDQYADYWRQNLHHTLINRAYCIANPLGYAGYGRDCWGLTASDTPGGYAAHSPTDDRGVIAPSAGLSAMPYVPGQAMALLRHLLETYPNLWSQWGFRDAFSPATGWMADATLAIEQAPIVIMVENYRSGLIWSLLSQAPEILDALQRLGFTRSPFEPARTS